MVSPKRANTGSKRVVTITITITENHILAFSSNNGYCINTITMPVLSVESMSALKCVKALHRAELGVEQCRN